MFDALVTRKLRRFMLAILAFSMVAAFLDLVFYEHYEDVWQVIPLVLLGVAAIALVGQVALRNRAATRAFQWSMVLLILGGTLGTILHAKGSADFHAELDASATRWKLVGAVLHSKVPPTLAPAALVQMGLLGMAAVYRYPNTRKVDLTGEYL